MWDTVEDRVACHVCHDEPPLFTIVTLLLPSPFVSLLIIKRKSFNKISKLETVYFILIVINTINELGYFAACPKLPTNL